MNPPLTPMAIAFAASPRPINQIQAVRRLDQIKASSSRYDSMWSVEANVRAKSEAPSLGRNATICTPSPRHGRAGSRHRCWLSTSRRPRRSRPASSARMSTPERSIRLVPLPACSARDDQRGEHEQRQKQVDRFPPHPGPPASDRSEEHTSELQSPDHLVCRLLLEKKKRQVALSRSG